MIERIDGCVLCLSTSPTVWHGDTLFALMDVAPLVEGHILLCSRLHYPSVADLPDAVLDELDEAYTWLRSLFLTEFGGFTVFEHGRTGHCLRRSPQERICHHMHIHLLPVAVHLAPNLVLGQSVPWRRWADVPALACDTDGYVIVDTEESGRRFYPVTRPLEPHYLRTVTAELLGDATRADWERTVGDTRSRTLVHRGRTRLVNLLTVGATSAPLDRADRADRAGCAGPVGAGTASTPAAAGHRDRQRSQTP